MVLTVVIFLAILTVLVLIHEFGHFAAARIIGVRVEEFGLGLPPRAAGKKFGNTIYSLNWLPIGGFVRLAGEDLEDAQKSKVKGAKAKEYFWARTKKERAVILTAGVFMNFLLAVGITTFLLVHGVKEPVSVHIATVMPGTPAATAGFQVHDVITDMTLAENPDAAGIHNPIMTDEIIQFTHINAGKAIDVTILRSGQTYHLTLTPRVNPPSGQGPMGVAILSDLKVHKYSLTEAPGKALVINLSRGRDMIVSLGTTIGQLAKLRRPQAEVAGPIGIAQVTGQAIQFGWEAVLELASILSLNLAILNILPIPALDGGRLAFVFLEKIFRRRVNPVFERNAHQIGMVILLGLILLVSINDILRLAHGG